MAQTVKEVKLEYPEAEVEVWAEDEHRIGLHPVNRMIWVNLGETPIAPVNYKYEWLWLMGFVHPGSGETYWWIFPCLNYQVFQGVLRDFADHFGIGRNNRVILVVDRASFHISPKIAVPEGIHLLFLPPKSPELQPAERLWPLTNEVIANQSFETIEQLAAVTSHRCRALLHQKELIRGLTEYHWWRDAVS